MKFALIGHRGHFDYYHQVLDDIPEFGVVAVAAAQPGESMDRFAAAPGVTPETPRYADYNEMLERESPDLVQVCVQNNLVPGFVSMCLQRGIPVMSEKPLAMDLETLSHLYELAQETEVPLAPLHGYRRFDCFTAVQDAVQKGRIGEPQASFSQISYKWGKKRGDHFKRRTTFPGLVPFIGIHAIDWLVWILGDVFVEVTGWESTTAHPEYPGCASQAGFLLRMRNGGVAAVTLDYLRPMSAPTHGDERMRFTGTTGVVESLAMNESIRLISEADGVVEMEVPRFENWYTTFVRSVRGECPSFISVADAFRVTEIAIKTQQAIDGGRVVSLADSPYTQSAA
jgi:predicted dehydrogenase